MAFNKRGICETATELLEMYAQGERDFTGLKIVACVLTAADLSGADFSFTYFIDCELSNVNFSGCNLRFTVFLGSDITGVNLDGAHLSTNGHQIIAELLRAAAERDGTGAYDFISKLIETHGDWCWRQFMRYAHKHGTSDACAFVVQALAPWPELAQMLEDYYFSEFAKRPIEARGDIHGYIEARGDIHGYPDD